MSVLIFGLSIMAVVYATLVSDKVGVIENPVLTRDSAIFAFMLSAACLITLVTHIDTNHILNAQTFKSGMSACICVLGVAWLGNTFVGAHLENVQETVGDILDHYPWLLALALFLASMLLYLALCDFWFSAGSGYYLVESWKNRLRSRDFEKSH